MKRVVTIGVALALALGSTAEGQRRIVIAAGTPEDVALQELGKIAEPEERIARLNAFVEEFAANPAAVAFGHWQLAQLHETQGDIQQALAHGEKALAAAPDNLDILVSLVQLSQQAGDSARLFDYAVRGGKAYHAILTEPRPANLDEETHQRRLQEDQQQAQPSYEYLEVAAFNALVAQEDPAKRMQQIEAFTPAFPGSRFEEQIAQYAIYTLQQLSDPERLVAWGERALKANPESLPTLALLASAFSEEAKPTNLNRAAEYARQAIKLAAADEAEGDATRRSLVGVAHSALGYTLLRQERTSQAIPELQKAVELLKGGDANAYASVLYRLGYAYAKVNRLTQARTVLMEAVQIEGPFQQPSRELLAKVNAARAGRD